MAPDTLIPQPDTLQIGWGWFQLLLSVTFVLHLLLMNALFGGAVVTLLGGLRKRGPGATAARDTAHVVPTLVALTVNAGVAPLLFLQVLYGHLFYTSSVIIAGWWLAIIPLLIVGYYATYAVALKYEAGYRPLLSILVVLILAFIGFLFTTNNTLALAPESWTAWFDRPDGSSLWFGIPQVLPRWLHMMVGAVAVGGLFVAVLQDRKAQRGDTEAVAARDWALAFFNIGTLIQMGIGMWWLMALPRPVMLQFMGGSVLGTAMLTLGFALSILAVVLGFRKKVRGTVITLVATMVVMVIMREIIRLGYVDTFAHPGQLEVAPQLSPFVFFLAVFAIGIGCMVYMLKLAARAGKEA